MVAETTETAELAGRFRSAELASRFAGAYDTVLRRWPLPVTSLDVAGEYGTTRVQACGPPAAAPLILLHGGGGTSPVWFANVGALGQEHRVYAVDQIGAAGRSVAAGRPLRRAEDLMCWLDGLVDGLGLDAAAFCGHSYGGWLALRYALRSPSRVTRLALLDPTDCFAGLRPGYRLRAVPLFIAPGEQRARRFISWETGRSELDAASLELACLGGGEYRGSRLVLPRRPDADRLRAMTAPVLVLLAERSKAHDIRRVGTAAQRLIPGVSVSLLPGASHHSIPANDPGQLNGELTEFLA